MVSANFLLNFTLCLFQAGASEHARTLGPKGSDCHKAAVIGDTIGDPLKDTSGPSLNILIKLMAVESLVFAPFFATQGGILFKYLLGPHQAQQKYTINRPWTSRITPAKSPVLVYCALAV